MRRVTPWIVLAWLVVAGNAERPVRGLLFALPVKIERPTHRPASEPDIGDIAPFRKVDLYKHMASPRAPRRVTDEDARRQSGDAKSKRGEPPGEKSVLLEAIATAPRLNQLCRDQRRVQMNATAKQRIQILERYAVGMQRMNRPQCIEEPPRLLGDTICWRLKRPGRVVDLAPVVIAE